MRGSTLALVILAAPALSVLALGADTAPPNYSGTWQLDPAHSQVPSGESITYNIRDSSGKVDFTRVIHERDGKELTSHFACQAGGGECNFDEGGRKARVSLWYDGPTLVILQTNTDDSSVTKWRLTLGPEGKTMNVSLQEMEPEYRTEKLVFDKKA
jgi:hypothetical protein